MWRDAAVAPHVELDDALAFARTTHQVVLITMRSNGRPQLSNVLQHCSEDGVIRVSVTGDRAKYINLAREPWAAMHVTRADFFAYAVLEGKAVDEEKRIITGIATTPSVDRADDIVEPEGAEFKLPLPFLWQHDSDNPVGNVTKAMVTSKGITVEIQLEKTDEPGLVKDRLDAAWQYIKLGLVRGLSIGFKGIETARIEGTYGIRFLKWSWLELSGVTIPANQDASILTMKSIDAPLLAATGKEPKDSDRPTTPAPGKKKSTPVKAQEGTTMKKTYAEQIASFEATRAAKSAEMDGIMEKSMESGETLDKDQKEIYDTLDAELKEIDEHLIRLRAAEARNKAAAVVVKGANADDASASRGAGDVTRVHINPKKVEAGIGFTRFVLAQARAKGNIIHAL